MATLRLTNPIDHRFVAIAQRVLNNALRIYRPRGGCVVHIDNWFDHKWLGFKSRNEEGDCTPLRVPFFEPSRILSRVYFRASADAPIRYEPAPRYFLYIPYRNRSGVEIRPSIVYLWYSRVCDESDRGSLMVYLSEEGKPSVWYASLRKNPDWRLEKVKGISKQEFSQCYNDYQKLQTDPAEYGFNINS